MAAPAQAYNLPQGNAPVPALGGGAWAAPTGNVLPAPMTGAPPFGAMQGGNTNDVHYAAPQLPQVPQLSLDDLRAMMGAATGGAQPQQQTAPQPAPAPPMGLPDYLKQEEKRLGVSKLTPDQAQQAAQDFGTGYVAPNYWALPGANKERVGAEMGAYGVQAQHVIDAYLKNGPAAENNKDSATKSFLKSAGAEVERTGGGLIGVASGIVPGLENIAHNIANPNWEAVKQYLSDTGNDISSHPFTAGARGVGDILGGISQLANGPYSAPAALASQGNADIQAGRNQAGQDVNQFLAMMGNPQDPKVRQAMIDVFNKNAPTDSSMAGAAAQTYANAYKLHPFAAGAGNFAGGVVPLLAAGAVSGGAALPYVAAAEGLGDTGANVADQMNAGQNTDAVRRQAVLDAALNTAMGAAPLHAGGRNVLMRALRGAAMNTGLNVAQQGGDIAANDANQFSGKALATNAGVGALLSLLGGKGEPKPPTPEAEGADTTTPPPGGAAAAADTGAGGAQPINTNAPSNITEHVQTMVNTNANPTGLPDKDFGKQVSSLTNDLNAASSGKGSKPWKRAVSDSTTPESAVLAATDWVTNNLEGDTWNAMNAAQRQSLIELTATKLGAAAKIDPQAISDVITGKAQTAAPAPASPETPPAAGSGTPPAAPEAPAAAPATLQEQPMPAGLEGQAPQVQSAAQPPAPAPAAGSGTAPANPLVKTNAQQDAEHAATANIVTEALASPGTPEAAKNKLRSRVAANAAKQYNEQYMQAALNGGVSSGPQEDAFRADPHFLAVKQAIADGTVKTPDQLGTFLKNARAVAEQQAAAPAPKNLKAASGYEDTKAGNQVRITDVGARSNVGPETSIVLETRSGPEDTNPLQLFVGKDGSLIPRNKALNADGSPTENVWTGGTKAQRNNVAKLLRARADTAVGSKEREAFTQQIADAINNKGRKPLKGAGKSTPPKPEAAVSNTAAEPATELEGQLRNQFPELPPKAIDQLHDAVASARMGDGHDLGDLLEGWKASGDLSKDDVKWLRAKAKEGSVATSKPLKASKSLKEEFAEADANAELPNDDYLDQYHENNASGESTASLEAQNRLRDERNAGQTRAIIRNDGSVEPLAGVDAVDTHARHGEVVVQRGVGKDDWTVLSHGDDLTRDLAAGKVNRARADLDSLHASVAPVRDVDVPGFGKVTIDQSHDVQLLGGSPNEGNKFYADKDWNPIAPVMKLDGTLADMDRSPYLGVHELRERQLEQQGWGYTEAHRQAEREENEAVRKAGFDPKSYQDSYTKDVAAAAKKVHGNMPDDIVEKPYEHPHSVRAREALADVQEHEDGEAGPHGEYTLPIEDLEGLENDRQANAKKSNQGEDTVAPLSVKREVAKITDSVRKGADIRETGQRLETLRQQIEQAKQEKALRDSLKRPQRGVEYVRSRLQKMVSESAPDSTHYKAGKFGLWLLEQNPNLANSLGVRIHSLEGLTGRNNSGPAGAFDPINRIFHINSKVTNVGTAVHEIMHSAEQLMPEELKNAVRGEYLGRLQNKLKQVTKNGNKLAQRYIELAIQNHVNPSAEARGEMNKLIRSGQLSLDEFYKYHNESEYWAVEATRLLNDRWQKNGLADKARQWLSGFFERVKNLFGIDNHHAVSKALDAMLKTPGEDYHEGMLSRRGSAADEAEESEGLLHDEVDDDEDEHESSASPADTYEEQDTNAPSHQSQRAATAASQVAGKPSTRGSIGKGAYVVEQMMNAHVGVEKAMQALRALGRKITMDNDVDSALARGRNMGKSIAKTDDYDVNRPAREWIDKNYARFDGNKTRFMDSMNRFFNNMNQLERIRSSWLEEAPLKTLGDEMKREKIVQGITAANYADRRARYAQLEKLAPQYTMSADDWGKAQNNPVDEMRSTLADLKAKYGIDEQSMAPLNTYMDSVRQRLHDRMVASGDVAADDPWWDARGWKWYVPLKLAKVEGTNDDVFDMASSRLNIRGMNATVKKMEGMKSFADTPFARLFTDVLRAGQRQGMKEKMNALKELATDPKTRKDLGITVTHYNGTPYTGFTNANGDHYDTIPLGRTEQQRLQRIVIHEGNDHLVLKFPADSQMLRGLLAEQNIAKPGAVLGGIGAVTNTLARGYTTIFPPWMIVPFMRDLNYVPLQLAVNKFDNPLHAIPFWGRYAVNVAKEMGAARRFYAEMKNDQGAVRRMAAANPNSEAGWAHRYFAEGGHNAYTSGFDAGSMNTLMGTLRGMPRDAKGILNVPAQGARAALEYTGRFADYLTQIPRIAAFRTGVEMGWGEKEAATQALRVLDYSESGVQGRRINAWLAFSRIGLTGVDAMRRAFTKPTGGFDYPKMAKWLAMFTALGAMKHMASTALLGQDDDGKDRMAKMEPETIGSGFLFPVGNDVVNWQVGLGMPQLLMAPGALSAAIAMGHMSAEDAAKAYYKIATRNLAFEPGGVKGNSPGAFAASLVTGLVPTVARPLVDIGENNTNFGYPIHPEAKEGQYNSDVHNKNTPQEFVDMARSLREWTNGAIDFYPDELEYLTKNYGGQLATHLINAVADTHTSGTSDTPMSSMPGIVHDEDFYQSRQLYDTMDNLSEAAKKYTATLDYAKENGATDEQAKAQASAMLRQNPDLAKQLQLYDQLKSARSARAEAMKKLGENKFMSDTGRQLQQKQIDSKLRQTLDKVQAQMH